MELKANVGVQKIRKSALQNQRTNAGLRDGCGGNRTCWLIRREQQCCRICLRSWGEAHVVTGHVLHALDEEKAAVTIARLNAVYTTKSISSTSTRVINELQNRTKIRGMLTCS